MNKIQSTFRQVSQDGRVGKADLKKILESALDGKGITKNEAAELVKLKANHGDKFTKQAGKAFDSFLSKMNGSWSSADNVHMKNFDTADMKELLAADPRASIYTGGGESSATTTPVDVSVGGGEASSTPEPVSVGGGEASSAPEPAPVDVGGGEASSRPAPTRRRAAPARSWTSSNSWGSSSRGGGGE